MKQYVKDTEKQRDQVKCKRIFKACSLIHYLFAFHLIPKIIAYLCVQGSRVFRLHCNLVSNACKQALLDFESLEKSFNELHQRYLKLKNVAQAMKKVIRFQWRM